MRFFGSKFHASLQKYGHLPHHRIIAALTRLRSLFYP